MIWPDACVHVMNLGADTLARHVNLRLSHINVGTGTDCTIRELAETMADVTGYKGRLEFDASKPDGTPRKLMDVSKLERLGWKAKTSLKDGLRQTFEWFLDHQDDCQECIRAPASG